MPEGLILLYYNKNLKLLARKLRNNMTKEERKLWYEYLRNCSARFLRQKIIGNYIVDFYSPKLKIVIELDGGQHFEDENLKKDRIRGEYLTNLGLVILRYNNFDINNNFENVCFDINEKIIPLNPPLQKGANSN